MSALDVELQRRLASNELNDEFGKETSSEQPRAVVQELLPTTRQRQFLVLVSGFFAVLLTIGTATVLSPHNL